MGKQKDLINIKAISLNMIEILSYEVVFKMGKVLIYDTAYATLRIIYMKYIWKYR